MTSTAARGTHEMTARWGVDNRSDAGAVIAASIAAGLGTASAAVSAYWALGGTAMLDTVGGEIERWGRQRSAGVVIALWVIVVFKLIGAVAPLVFAGVGETRLPAWTRARCVRQLGWATAVGLTVYGGVLTVVGLLVETGVLDPVDDAEEHAPCLARILLEPVVRAVEPAFAVSMWRS